MLEDLYKKIVLDHYRRPRHSTPLAAPDVEVPATNPLCGDAVVLQLRWRDGRLEEVAFYGRGCTLCLASGSIMAEWIHGRARGEVAESVVAFDRMLRGEAPAPGFPEAVTALRGVLSVPARVPCVRLAWDALSEASAG